MSQIRQSKEFEFLKLSLKKQSAQHHRRSKNLNTIRVKERQAFTKRKASNPDHIRELNQQAVSKRKANNLGYVKELNLLAFKKRKYDNNDKIKQVNKNTQKKRRLSINTDLCQTEHDISDPAVKLQKCKTIGEMFESQDCSVDQIVKLIQSFHDSIVCSPEYICTCCDQLWYRSSVVKCNMSKYSTTCSESFLDKCITGTKSVSNNEWICYTCHSNLSEGKLPACTKANRMQFPVKPDCLDLTPLEERLISPRIPFMQICELPRGGQLSIHGNVVNVPADVSSTVSTLPRPLNESQTIPIKLKRRLNYKHRYQQRC